MKRSPAGICLRLLLRVLYPGLELLILGVLCGALLPVEAPGKFHSTTVLMRKRKARNTLSKGCFLLPLILFFILDKRGLRGNLVTAFQCVKGSFTRRTEARSSGRHMEKTRGNGYGLHWEWFHLDIVIGFLFVCFVFLYSEDYQ